jgi:hypothetical protein
MARRNVREVLTHARARREHLIGRRVDVRRALLVAEALVDEPGGRAGEAGHGSAAGLLRRRDELAERRQVGDVVAGREELEELLGDLRALLVERPERRRLVEGRGGMDHHDRRGLDAQRPVRRQHVEAVHPVPEIVLVRRAAGGGAGAQAEREAALPAVVAGPEADLVVALRDDAVVLEVGHVEDGDAAHWPIA